MYREFYWQFRVHLFDFNQEDLAEVRAVTEAKGWDWDDTIRYRWPYITKRVRRSIPAAHIVYPRMKGLLEKIETSWKDATTQKDFFTSSPRAKAIIKTLLKEFANGEHSDIPGVCLYERIGRDADGLSLYRSYRGSNNCENVCSRTNKLINLYELANKRTDERTSKQNKQNKRTNEIKRESV